MRFKKIVLVHSALTFIFGIILGITIIATDTDASANHVMAIPLSIAVLFLGYSGPFMLGGTAIYLLQKRFSSLSQKSYVITYYLLLGLLVIELYLYRHQTDSGFILLAIPYLPIGAFIATISIACIKKLTLRIRSDINR